MDIIVHVESEIDSVQNNLDNILVFKSNFCFFGDLRWSYIIKLAVFFAETIKSLSLR